MGDRAMRRWLIATIILLSLSIFINYIDRGNLSTAAPIIKNEFHLTASQLGFLLTSFFITYTVLHPGGGWLVDRFQAFRVLLVGFTVWSLATIFTGLAGSFAALFASRLLLGAGESVAFPSCWKIICQCFTETQRGVANAVLFVAMALGPAFGILLGAYLIASYGWRAFFIGFGLISMVWLVPWLIVGSKCITERRKELPTSPTFRAILSTPDLWGASLGHAGGTYTWYFVLTWIPYYLVHERHFTLGTMSFISAGAYILTAISIMTSGWVADRWIRAGASPTLARKTFLCLGLSATAIFMLACAVSNGASFITFLMLAGFAWGLATPNVWAAVQTLAGPEAIGRWSGIQNTVGSISGIIAPALTGVLVDRTGSFLLPFLVASAVAAIGAFAWIFLVGPIEEREWSAHDVSTVRSYISTG